MGMLHLRRKTKSIDQVERRESFRLPFFLRPNHHLCLPKKRYLPRSNRVLSLQKYSSLSEGFFVRNSKDKCIKLDDQITSLLLWINAIHESVLTALFSSRIETILEIWNCFYGTWNLTGDMQVLLCLTLIV